MNAIHMLRALGTLDFRARPTVQSRLAANMASACDFETRFTL